MNYQHHVNFIEDPAKRGPNDKGICVAVTGTAYTSVYVEVTPETFCSDQFQEWLKCDIMTRLQPNHDGVRIAVVNGSPIN